MAEYQRYITVLRRYFPIIVFLTILGAGSAYLFSARQPKIYKATATLLINPSAPNQAIPYLQAAIGGGGSTASSTLEQLASTYDVYLTSNAFDTLAVKQLKLNETPDQLGTQISSSLVGTTNFFQISVTAHLQPDAVNIANGVAKLFIAQNLQLQGQGAASGSSSADQTEMTYLQGEISTLRATDQRLMALRNPTQSQQAQTISVEQRISSLTTSYAALATLVRSQSSSTQNVNTATLTGPAVWPHVPISPKTRQNIIYGTIAGLVIGLLLAFLLDYMDLSIRTPEDAERAVGSAPLAVVATLDGKSMRKRKQSTAPTEAAVVLTESQPEAAARLFTLHRPHDRASEAFRTLRTNLAFSTIGKPASTLLVTSMQPGEGKTTVAANLAVVLAQSGKRVILVDTDLRRPAVHSVFGVPKFYGFTDLLLGQATLGVALKETAVPNLQVLPSGSLPSNPAELLSSDAIVRIIELLQEQADMVIFDSPPMGALTDAVVLSARLEGTLMVCRSGLNRPAALAKNVEALKKVGGRPLGCVLNMVDQSAFGSYGYYYYSYA